MSATLPPIGPGTASVSALGSAGTLAMLPSIAPASADGLDLGKLMGETLLRLISEERGDHKLEIDVSGRVGFDEFKQAVLKLGLAVGEARRICDHFDRDGTGFITFTELHSEVRS